MFLSIITIIALAVIITALIAIAKSLFKIIEMASLPLYIGSTKKRSFREIIAYQVFRGLVISTLVIISVICVILFVINYLPFSRNLLPFVIFVIMIIGYFSYNSVEKFNSKIKITLLKGYVTTTTEDKQEEELPINRDLPISDILSIGDTIENKPIKKNSPYLGKSLKTSRIRERTGASVIGIRRNEQLLINPDPTEKVIDGDILILLKKPR